MDFIDKIQELATRISNQVEHIQTEEATKNAFILPFIAALDYNVFDPTEVLPEYTADIGTKKGEKVDYAILMGNTPVILFECKHCGVNLDQEHASQLYRYFTATEARFGVLTNGILYRFYSDLDEPNKMDTKPFLEFNMFDIEEPLVEELKKFTKSSFDLNNILTTATDLKYTTELKKTIEEQINSPSDDFVKFFASQVYSGRMTQQIRDQFFQLTKKAFKQVINERINERLKKAIVEESTSFEKEDLEDNSITQLETEIQTDDGIITTEEEFEGYYIVKTILRDAVDAKRVSIRDTKSYCGILLDDNNRKSICRLYFDTPQKYLGFFDEQKKLEKIPITDVDDIYKYADRLKAKVAYYDTNSGRQNVQSFRGKSITSFEFKGTRYEVNSWKGMLIQICNIMRDIHSDQFEKVLKLSGSKRPYFSRNADDLRGAERINGTQIFVDAHQSASRMVKLSIDVISLFGYAENDLSIEAQ